MSNKPAGKVTDPEIIITPGKDVVQLSLLDLVANGRLYVQNNDGTMQKVRLVSYWVDDDLMSTCDAGHEFDENGKTTRRWR